MRKKDHDPVLKILRMSYERQKAANPAFSQRAFAKKLGTSSGALAAMFSGSRAITEKTARRWVDSGGLDPQERLDLAHLFGIALGGASAKACDYTELTQEQSKAIDGWWSFAILSLLRTTGFRSDPKWIARRLGLGSDLIQNSLSRLERAGLIARNASGEWFRTNEAVRSSDDRVNLAIRNSQKDLLKLALKKIESVPLSERDFTSFMMAIDPLKLPQAKVLVRKFQDDLSSLLETTNATEVFHLGVQIFPLTYRLKSVAGSH